MAKRRTELPRLDEEATPSGKKLRSAEKPHARRPRKPENQPPQPAFDVEEEEGYDMAASPKPPSAEEFKTMLREGLANVAKKEQLDQMMVQIKGNSNALISLERKVDSTNEANDRRFKRIEDRLIDNPNQGSASYEESKRAAYEKSRRSLRAWPIAGEDNDAMNASFRDFAVDALLIQDTVVRNAKIQSIVRVRSSPHNVAYSEVLVTFNDFEERDFYFSKAKNLATYRDEHSPFSNDNIPHVK